jgi:hypothetical protein
MTYSVHVSGRANPMVFDRLSTAERYRHVMNAAGLFAWIS